MKAKYSLIVVAILFSTLGCKNSKVLLSNKKVQDEVEADAKKYVPTSFQDNTNGDSTSLADIKWRDYFSDANLATLIDSALKNNQELNITLQEIEIARNEARARKGEYLPQAGLMLGMGGEKTPEFTRNGAVEHNLNIEHNKAFPEPLGDFMVGAYFSWEIDIWKKLRNARSSAVSRYLGTIEGKNFTVTNLVSEIADSYYELLALDNQLDIVSKFIKIQSDALGVVKTQKEAARVSQLAVNRFEAQLAHTQNLQYDIKQKIVETENKINFLVGRFPQTVVRSSSNFMDISADSAFIGFPVQVLQNRPDIRKAEQELIAAKLDVKVARAEFYPTLGIKANLGMQAYNPKVWFDIKSLLASLVGDLVAPLINRNAIWAHYNGAKAKQLQALYEYQQTIVKACNEIATQTASVKNAKSSFETKSKESDLLTQSVTISNDLFSSARADYMEVLLTQREALETKMELTEVKLKQLTSKVGIYKALGGGWK
jgi:NodT family efflux transporter outer membrane factor (OMF) lipoprotein